MQRQRRVRDATILQPKDSLDVQWAQRVIPSPQTLLHFLLNTITGHLPYHAPAEVRSVLVYYPEAALHELVLELGVGPVAQLRVHRVAAT